MSKEIKIAGSISFGGKRLNVYGDLDAPLFKAKDISHAIGYSSGNEWRMLEMCEEDEKLKLPLVVAGQRRSVNFVTENGLYNILAQSRMEIARSWRRVVHDELINMRKEKGRNIAEQFEEWDHANLNVSNEFSIVADPFAYANFHSMRFIEYMGAKWKISNVEVQYPRLILTVGGVYNEQTTETA